MAARDLFSPDRFSANLRTFVVLCLLSALLGFAREGLGAENVFSQNNDTRRSGLSSPVPRNFLFDGDVKEWQTTAPTFALTKYQPLGREGMIWIGQSEKGVIVAGKILGEKPRWPRSPDAMAAGDHIEVWLADANEPELPPIGWGNQFGHEVLTTETDCKRFQSQDTRKPNEDAVKGCVAWYKAQVNYRKAFSKLFVRQWQIAPGSAVETYAAPAFFSFDQELRQKLRLLRPSGSPDVKIQEAGGKNEAYSFELVIPWNAFPPLKPLQLKNIRIMVDVFSPGAGERKYGVFSSTSPDRKYGQARTFNALALKPKDYYLTPCNYELPDSDPVITLDPAVRYLSASPAAQLYFLPTGERDLRTLLLLDNEVHGYQYDPDPRSNSPIVHPVDFFTRQISPQELLCGPRLAYLKDNAVYKWHDFVLDSRQFFESRKLEDGSILVKEGPRVFTSYYGSGQCGACPRVMLHIYRIDTGTKVVSEAFGYEAMTQTEVTDIDINVSEDWKTVTIFEEHMNYNAEKSSENSRWTKNDYCLDPASGEYNECGSRDPSPPPAIRVLKPEN